MKISLGEQNVKSSVVPNTVDPVWDEQFEFNGTMKGLLWTPLRIQAFDSDWGGLSSQVWTLHTVVLTPSVHTLCSHPLFTPSVHTCVHTSANWGGLSSQDLGSASVSLSRLLHRGARPPSEPPAPPSDLSCVHRLFTPPVHTVCSHRLFTGASGRVESHEWSTAAPLSTQGEICHENRAPPCPTPPLHSSARPLPPAYLLFTPSVHTVCSQARSLSGSRGGPRGLWAGHSTRAARRRRARRSGRRGPWTGRTRARAAWCLCASFVGTGCSRLTLEARATLNPPASASLLLCSFPLPPSIFGRHERPVRGAGAGRSHAQEQGGAEHARPGVGRGVRVQGGAGRAGRGGAAAALLGLGPGRADATSPHAHAFCPHAFSPTASFSSTPSVHTACSQEG